MLENYYYSSINELAKHIWAKKVSPLEVVHACLKRIKEFEPKLNAFITVLADQALEQAKDTEAEIQAGKWRGPLHGIPIGIKDFYDTAGIKTTAAFERFKDRVPTKDAVGVAKLKEAGAIIIGKTNMHQLGMGTTGLDSYFGPIHNPWNAEYIPGGSSAGSAAAVASGMCYATFDTDAIGSCRLPAACCGVVGFKGTYGLISPKGILEGEEAPDEMILWLSHSAITTRSVEDTALILDVLAEKKGQANAADFFGRLARDKKLRIGVANNFRADQEVWVAFERAIETIRGLGYTTSSVAAPFGDPTGGIGSIEADRKAISGQAFKDIDILLLPTTATTVPTIKDAGTNQQALSPENTVFANYYGIPAISILCGFDKHGLPLGFQIVGKPWDEDAVLRLAHHYQISTEYSKKHPIK
ncbi:MAG TPA: amidase [Nitrososphaera sp.]|jgi:aspartyl-tRNA(Asn)/glutamyl-tRNA(Gln) amidotransferase subunit A|nr:amidase [Nitrososphaera sp.]